MPEASATANGSRRDDVRTAAATADVAFCRNRYRNTETPKFATSFG
jgi:hypothetical protein